MGDPSAMPDVLAELGPRLRRLRERRGITLTALAAKTEISKSTLSRLENGQRKPSLELLLPLAETYHLPLDELVGAPRVGDPRVRTRARTRNGRLVFPLTQPSSGMAVWKGVIPPERERKLRTHAGYEWLYVLSGEMRLILGEQDIIVGPGEAAEFDTSCRTGSAQRVMSQSRSSASTAAMVSGCTSAQRRAARARRPEHPSSPDRKPPRGATPENGNRAWRPHFAAGTLPRAPDERDTREGEEPLLGRWERVGRDNWGVRSRLGLSRHRALPERIGASRLKPQIVQ